MTKLIGSQLSLIAESDFEYAPVGDWDWDELGTNKWRDPNSPSELGTNKILVPNFSLSELGTNKILVPNFSPSELGTNKILVPNSDEWKPPIGCLQQKWIKDHQYWYWRYYDNRRKKRSLYLAKDYNKAVRKAIKIGVPTDAKLSNLSASDPQTQTENSTTDNLINLAATAHGTSRSTHAA